VHRIVPGMKKIIGQGNKEMVRERTLLADCLL
jgi:hypothetical protein